MTNEEPNPPAPRRPYEVFGLTQQEVLYWRVNQERFEQILDDEVTMVHEIKASSNAFGEFLFVTMSRMGDRGRIAMTFYGLGYHEHRERWLTEEWFWYQANPHPDVFRQRIKKQDAKERLQEHLESIQLEIDHETQTERGQLFEMLADLTDDDGALAEIEDIEMLALLLRSGADDEMEGKAPEETKEKSVDGAPTIKEPSDYEELEPVKSPAEKPAKAPASKMDEEPGENLSEISGEEKSNEILAEEGMKKALEETVPQTPGETSPQDDPNKPEPSPTGENLLDQTSRERLPPLYSGEEKGLDALAQVKFFTPWSNWTWFASEFDGKDLFFGLVVGFEIELGYFSLKELQSVIGPLGLLIERDLYFKPKTLRELMEKHDKERDWY